MMAFCKFCGAQIQDGVAFCTACGSPLKTAVPTSAQAAQQPQQFRQQTAAPQSPFAPAQRTADRVFPSQQRKGAAQPDAQIPPAWAGNAQPPYGAAPCGAQSGSGVDWEHFQPRKSPKSATRLILAASVLICAVIVMVWTLLIR